MARGIVLKDLVAIDAQAKDYSGSEQLVNIGKYRMLWNQLTVLRRTQLTSPAIHIDLDHMRILRVTNYMYMYSAVSPSLVHCIEGPKSSQAVEFITF